MIHPTKARIRSCILNKPHFEDPATRNSRSSKHSSSKIEPFAFITHRHVQILIASFQSDGGFSSPGVLGGIDERFPDGRRIRSSSVNEGGGILYFALKVQPSFT